MRFTLGSDASTLTHPVQLCLAAILMKEPSTYRKCIHSLSSKTATSGYDSLNIIIYIIYILYIYIILYITGLELRIITRLSGYVIQKMYTKSKSNFL